MRLPAVPNQAMVDHLNDTYFQQLWSAPNDHYRANVELSKVSDRVKTGIVPFGQSVVGLPTTDQVYAVYSVGYRLFNQFANFPEGRWVKAVDFLKPAQAYIAVYGTSGRTVPTGAVWLYYYPNRNTMLVAIGVSYTKSCVGELYPTLYLTVYKDTTRATPITGEMFTIGNALLGLTPPDVALTKIATAVAACPVGTFVFVNGFVHTPDHLPPLVAGDLVQISSDPDIIAVVDVTVDDNQTGYSSTLYGEYRELLHIPKAVNPDNVLLTTDNLTALVYDPINHRGVLGHRVNQHAIESVTHNDVSMSRTALNGFTMSLGAQSVIVKLCVRLPVYPNYLTDDVNHIKDLYALDDVKIVKQLLGLSSPQIPEWKASNLERSTFLSLFYKFDQLTIDEALPAYLAAMGYYDVASVLGQQMRVYTYKGAQVSIKKPARMFGIPCKALVYANGLKVPEDLYLTTDTGGSSFYLGFKLGAGVKVGDRIMVYIVDGGDRVAVPAAPVTGRLSIDLPSPDFTIYEIVDLGASQPIWNGSVSTGYRLLPNASANYITATNPDGTTKFTFRSKHAGKNFYCIPNHGMTTAQYDINPALNNGESITIDLKERDIDFTLYPLLNRPSLEVYINRKRLVEGLDFICDPVINKDGVLLQQLLVISNCAYFDLGATRNQVEVVVHGDQRVSFDQGYVIERKLYRDDAPMIYTRSSSRVFVRGVMQEQVSESGNIAIISAPGDNGAPFIMEHHVSYGVTKLLANYSPAEDINLRGRIEHALGIVPPTLPSTVILDRLHALYSPFLAAIVHDVEAGAFHIRDEPRDEAFLRQFKPYEILLDRDPIVGNNTQLIDRRFVSLAAHYVNAAVTDPQQMLRMQRLTGFILRPSELDIKTVLI